MIEKNRLLEILFEWNIWHRDVKEFSGIKRDIIRNIKLHLEDNEIITIIGSRRAGKSTLMFQIMEELLSKGVEKEQFLYINFEEPAFSQYLNLDLLIRIYKVYREEINLEKRPYIFLDEVQNLPLWEKWVRAKHDLRQAKIFVTGSSSKLLSSEFSTVLTGRHLSYSIYPLSFSEFMRFNNVKILTKADEIRQKTRLRKLLKEYMHFGGYPKVVLTNNERSKKEILKQYFEDILYRDIIERYKIREISVLRNMAIYYLTNMSNLSSYNRIKKILNVSMDVARNYSTYFSEAFLLKEVPKFSFKVSQHIMNPKKIYAVDHGLRNAISFRFSEDLGRIAENIVFNELSRQDGEIYYFKNKNEVDFIFRQGMAISGQYQVTFSDLEDELLFEREIKGILQLSEKYNLNKATIITEDKDDVMNINNVKIFFISLINWLLQRDDRT